jgi:hypothetical protein
MLDIIEVGNQYYVSAESSFADKETSVLMSGDMFGVFRSERASEKEAGTIA